MVSTYGTGHNETCPWLGLPHETWYKYEYRFSAEKALARQPSDVKLWSVAHGTGGPQISRRRRRRKPLRKMDGWTRPNGEIDWRRPADGTETAALRQKTYRVLMTHFHLS